MTVKPFTISVKQVLGHSVLGHSLRYIDIRIFSVQSKNIFLSFCVILVCVEVQCECEFESQELRKGVARHFDASQHVFAADQRSHNKPSKLSTLAYR